jgi:RNA polymerase-binding transcription factor DksA
MKENLFKQLKNKLEKERAQIEEGLKRFAKRDERLPGDWDSKFPKWNGEASLELTTDEVEEYLARLPLEYALELKLRDINLALEKMEKGKYGVCEKCKKAIEIERLKANPAAKYCLRCISK